MVSQLFSVVIFIKLFMLIMEVIEDNQEQGYAVVVTLKT